MSVLLLLLLYVATLVAVYAAARRDGARAERERVIQILHDVLEQRWSQTTRWALNAVVYGKLLTYQEWFQESPEQTRARELEEQKILYHARPCAESVEGRTP